MVRKHHQRKRRVKKWGVQISEEGERTQSTISVSGWTDKVKKDWRLSLQKICERNKEPAYKQDEEKKAGFQK